MIVTFAATRTSTPARSGRSGAQNPDLQGAKAKGLQELGTPKDHIDVGILPSGFVGSLFWSVPSSGSSSRQVLVVNI